jgi:hypothetical protein
MLMKALLKEVDSFSLIREWDNRLCPFYHPQNASWPTGSPPPYPRALRASEGGFLALVGPFSTTLLAA